MKRALSYFTVLLIFIPILAIEPIRNLNLLIVDQLHSSPARNEIVIVGIDDKSLNKIGAWPWSRDIFAEFLNNVATAKPAVVGFDIIFAENREGDSKFQDSIDSYKDQIVLANKTLVEGVEFANPVFNSKSGYVNFLQDSDGKIRRNTPFLKTRGDCTQSFSFQIILTFLRVDSSNCEELKIRDKNYPFIENRIFPQFSRDEFTTISFIDVLNSNFDKKIFENKIVLVGSTALDLRTNLNDNFTDIFGNPVAGVKIHANILNSFLNDDLLIPINYLFSITGSILFALLTFELFIRTSRIKANLAIFGIIFIVLNFSLIILFEFNIIPDFVTVNLYFAVALVSAIIFKYLSQQREKVFVEMAFGQYLNKKLLSELKKNPENLNLGGQSREVTTLFSDIRGFTSISERLSPSELISFLNNYLDFMSQIILEEEGTIDKFIGDSIMALWNTPLEDNEHATRSVRTSIKMVSMTKEFSKGYKDLPKIEIGIGINTGDVVVGNIGGSQRFDYTVIGDHVNLASRVEGLTKKYNCSILITENTKDKVTDSSIKFREIDEVIVKGRNSTIKIYEPFTFENDLYDNYSKAYELYKNGKFKEALKIFESNKEDPVSEIMAERCIVLIKKTTDNWDGIWRWEDK